MTLMNIAMTTLLNGIYLGALLAAAMMLLLKLFPRLNPTTRFTVLWITLLAVVVLLAAPLTPRCLPESRCNPCTYGSTGLPAGTQGSRCPCRGGCGAKVCVNIRATSGNAFSECLPNFLALRIAIRAFSDSHTLGKVSSCAGNGVDDVLVGAACPVRRGILGFAKAEIKRNAGVARLANTL
jgi:hypothetical protein